MVHHPLLGPLARWRELGLPFFIGADCGCRGVATADALTAPLALGLAFEQLGALLAGSGFGQKPVGALGCHLYPPIALLWSGAPLDVALHPGAGIRGVGIFCAFDFVVGLAAATAATRRCCRIVFNGRGRSGFCHRVLARP